MIFVATWPPTFRRRDRLVDAPGCENTAICVLLSIFTHSIGIPSFSRTRISITLIFYNKIILPFFDICRPSTFYSFLTPNLERTLPSTFFGLLRYTCAFLALWRCNTFWQDVRHKDCRLWKDPQVRLVDETIAKLPLKVNSHKDSSEMHETSEARVDRPSYITPFLLSFSFL